MLVSSLYPGANRERNCAGAKQKKTFPIFNMTTVKVTWSERKVKKTSTIIEKPFKSPKFKKKRKEIQPGQSIHHPHQCTTMLFTLKAAAVLQLQVGITSLLNGWVSI